VPLPQGRIRDATVVGAVDPGGVSGGWRGAGGVGDGYSGKVLSAWSWTDDVLSCTELEPSCDGCGWLICPELAT